MSRGPRPRALAITVKIKLRDGELFIFKEHTRAFDVASRVACPPPAPLPPPRTAQPDFRRERMPSKKGREGEEVDEDKRGWTF